MNLAYNVNGRTYVGHLARGVTSGLAPGVLVIHGGGGLGSHARRRADMLAELGYIAFACDLFGEQVKGLDHAHALVSAFTENWCELRNRCSAGLDVLRSQPNVDPERLAAVGFCFGGQAALELGRAGAPLRAIVGFHSQLATCRPQDSVRIGGAVLVCLGDQDCFVSGQDRDAFMQNMTASGVDCQLLLFAGISHSFTDPFAEASGVPGLKYDFRADCRAWDAMQTLFHETLRDPQAETHTVPTA